MNERIRELADQAELTIRDSRGNTYMSHPEFNKKFAELIVGECVSVVDSMADPEDSERYFWAIQNASQKIKEHFGAEE